MASIKGRYTSPEMVVRKCLRRLHCRYRGNVRQIVGTPDIVLTGWKKVIFVHGCFWHGHKGCVRATKPKTNKQFWKKKIAGNIKRDTRLTRELRKLGWTIFVVWQCQTKDTDQLQERLSQFIER